MFVCEFVWDPRQAQEVSAQVERATGKPCPCKRGLPCPFVRIEGEPVALATPRLRPGEQKAG